MKITSRILVPLIPVTLAMVSAFSHSCANTTTPPSGGPKDTIPPVIEKVFPLQGSTNVDCKKTQLVITFDEYVVIKEKENIFLSPPLDKAVKSKLKGKSVVVYFEETQLDSGKTYVLELTDAIADNNEGNLFPGYTLVFSTGDRIDSMLVSGKVLDCNTLNPVKGATVMLYKDHSDSAIFKHRPDAATKTDDWGYFCVRNIQDTLYRMYAVLDEGKNNVYDPDADKVAFIDSLIRPVKKVVDTLEELKKYEMKDTLHCLGRPAQYQLNLFREKPSKQYIVNKERVGDRTAYITFMAPGAQIDSIWMQGVPAEKLITQFNLQKDSLEIWVNDQRKQPDTLKLNVNYLKTDTTGKLVPFHELVKLPRTKQQLAAKRSKDVKKEDTTCVFTLNSDATRIEQYGLELEFKYPIIADGFDSLGFTWISPRQKTGKMKYSITRDSLNLRKYTIWPAEKFQSGYEYHVLIPHRKFRDVNGYYNDSLEVKVSLPNDDKLSSLLIHMEDVKDNYIVDLLDEKKSQIIRSFVIFKDTDLLFPYLKQGKYCVRITEDKNRNSMVETGNLLTHRQPEQVKFYTLKGGNEYINIMEMTEMEQTLNVSELFRE